MKEATEPAAMRPTGTVTVMVKQWTVHWIVAAEKPHTQFLMKLIMAYSTPHVLSQWPKPQTHTPEVVSFS